MATVEFGDWLPDQAQMATGVVQALNTIRTPAGYRPLPDIKVLSKAAIPAPAPALVMVRDHLDDIQVFAVGNDGHVYSFDRANLNWLQRTTAPYPNTPLWYFVEFGNKLLAANGQSQILSLDLSSTTTKFAPISGSAPHPKFITLIKDQIFAGNYTAVPEADRIGWSAINDPTNWGSDQSLLMDYQDNPDCGALMGLVGGAYGTALFEKVVKRISFVGPPVIYEFDPILNSHGCIIEGSVVAHLNFVFYISPAGFMMFDGNSVTPIGAEQVDRWFFADLQMSGLDSIRAGVDPRNHIIMWIYPGAGGDGVTNNHCIIFNLALRKWSHGQMDASCMGQVALPGYTLDELDSVLPAGASPGGIDSLQASLDSRTWQGGQLFLGAMDYDGNLCNFTAPPRTAVIDTKQVNFTEMRRSMLSMMYPVVEGDQTAVSAQVFSKGRAENSWGWGPILTENSEGWIGCRREGRFHRIRVFIDGWWTHALGVEYVAWPMGFR